MASAAIPTHASLKGLVELSKKLDAEVRSCQQRLAYARSNLVLIRELLRSASTNSSQPEEAELLPGQTTLYQSWGLQTPPPKPVVERKPSRSRKGKRDATAPASWEPGQAAGSDAVVGALPAAGDEGDQRKKRMKTPPGVCPVCLRRKLNVSVGNFRHLPGCNKDWRAVDVTNL